MIGAAPAAGLGNPKYAPKSLKKKNQAKTETSPHKAADVKNARGEGKKDVNMNGLVEIRVFETLVGMDSNHV